MYERAKYKETFDTDWHSIPDHVATIKYDGANFWMPVSADGSLSFISRRPSAKGGYPDRTESLPHLTTKKFPELAGHIYNVELIHTGHEKDTPESHSRLSGILNSLPPRAIETQRTQGPVRAVLHNVINPEFPTYKEKLLHMKEVENRFGNSELMFVAEPVVDKVAIQALIEKTKANRQEGVIITSLTRHEKTNPRMKIKHKELYNLRVSKIIQEVDKTGKLKPSMGAVEVIDATGRVVGKVGSGFSHKDREDAWNNPGNWVGKLIQVETMGLASKALRMPIYNGDADGEIDTVK